MGYVVIANLLDECHESASILTTNCPCFICMSVEYHVMRLFSWRLRLFGPCTAKPLWRAGRVIGISAVYQLMQESAFGINCTWCTYDRRMEGVHPLRTSPESPQTDARSPSKPAYKAVEANGKSWIRHRPDSPADATIHTCGTELSFWHEADYSGHLPFEDLWPFATVALSARNPYPIRWCDGGRRSIR